MSMVSNECSVGEHFFLASSNLLFTPCARNCGGKLEFVGFATRAAKCTPHAAKYGATKQAGLFQVWLPGNKMHALGIGMRSHKANWNSAGLAPWQQNVRPVQRNAVPQSKLDFVWFASRAFSCLGSKPEEFQFALWYRISLHRALILVARGALRKHSSLLCGISFRNKFTPAQQRIA